MLLSGLLCVGCRSSRDAADAQGQQAALLPPEALSRPFALLELHRPDQLATRGGAQLRARTQFDVQPPSSGDADAAPVTLVDEAQIVADADGHLRIRHDNDHGYSTEAVVHGDSLYMRVLPGPYIKRRPEDEEVLRLLAAADNTPALLELAVPWIDVDPKALRAEAQAVGGHQVFKVQLTRRARPQLLPRPVPGQRSTYGLQRTLGWSRLWREGAQVEELSGTALVDRERKALLGLRLKLRFRAKRAAEGGGGGFAQVQVDHRMSLAFAGAEAGAAEPVTPPQEWEDTPTRPRPMLDRQELLGGLGREQRPHLQE